jgi:hypothetical protein
MKLGRNYPHLPLHTKKCFVLFLVGRAPPPPFASSSSLVEYGDEPMTTLSCSSTRSRCCRTATSSTMPTRTWVVSSWRRRHCQCSTSAWCVHCRYHPTAPPWPTLPQNEGPRFLPVWPQSRWLWFLWFGLITTRSGFPVWASKSAVAVW